MNCWSILQISNARQQIWPGSGRRIFDEVENWLAAKKMDSTSMKSRRAIQNELLTGLLDELAFEPLRNEPEFQAVLRRLKDGRQQREKEET